MTTTFAILNSSMTTRLLSNIDLLHFTLVTPIINRSVIQSFNNFPPKKREAALLARLSDDPEFISFYTSTDKLTFLGVLMQRSFSYGSIGHTQISLNPYSDTLKELLEESRLLEDSLRRSSRPS